LQNYEKERINKLLNINSITVFKVIAEFLSLFLQLIHVTLQSLEK
jgi:hypothetical protein